MKLFASCLVGLVAAGIVAHFIAGWSLVSFLVGTVIAYRSMNK